MVDCASSRLANQCKFRQYFRNLQLKLSTNAFWFGLPGKLVAEFTIDAGMTDISKHVVDIDKQVVQRVFGPAMCCPQ